MKDPNAVALGRLGGKASRRLATLTHAERLNFSYSGARALWEGHRKGGLCRCRGCLSRWRKARGSAPTS
jgi:hypothetical protein